MNKVWLFSVFILCFFLVSCSNEILEESVYPMSEEKQEKPVFENKEGIKVVASEKRLPFNFFKVLEERKEIPHSNSLVNKVDNQTQYEEIWSFFNLEQQIPKVDFSVNEIYFIGVLESGSCPYELENKNMFIEDQVLNINFSRPKSACTFDARPRTFVIAVSKGNSNNIKNVVLGQVQ